MDFGELLYMSVLSFSSHYKTTSSNIGLNNDIVSWVMQSDIPWLA